MISQMTKLCLNQLSSLSFSFSLRSSDMGIRWDMYRSNDVWKRSPFAFKNVFSHSILFSIVLARSWLASPFPSTLYGEWRCFGGIPKALRAIDKPYTITKEVCQRSAVLCTSLPASLSPCVCVLIIFISGKSLPVSASPSPHSPKYDYDRFER